MMFYVKNLLLKKQYFGYKLSIVSIIGIVSSMLLSLFIINHVFNKFEAQALKRVNTHLISNNETYIKTHLFETTAKIEHLINDKYKEINILAKINQNLIDYPNIRQELGERLNDIEGFNQAYIYNKDKNWSQNAHVPNEKIVSSIWGYLHTKDGRIKKEVQTLMDETLVFNLIAPAIFESSQNSLQMYYIGSKSLPYFRSTPYTDMAQTFDRLYPGHNENNFWDFFFPGIMQDWKMWKQNPQTQPVKTTDVTVTSPYVDALTGEHIISFFQPLWQKDRLGPEGIVGVDVTLKQVREIISKISLMDSGFALLIESNGNVLASSEGNTSRLGVTSQINQASMGVKVVSNTLEANLLKQLHNFKNRPQSFNVVKVQEKSYLVYTTDLKSMNVWQENTKIHKDNWKLVYFIPEANLYASVDKMEEELEESKDAFIVEILIILLIVHLFMLVVTFYLTKRLTAGIRYLSRVADKIKNNDYTARVDFKSDDELGQLGETFNNMVETIRSNEEHLQEVLKEKTEALELSNKELQYLASVDTLTQIMNRRSFFEYGDKLLSLSRHQKDDFTIIMCDLDEFKEVNDTYGHSAGDEVLKQFSKKVSSLLRKNDVFARIGGEEFAIILINIKDEDAIKQATRIREMVEILEIDIGREKLHITVSMGVASASEEDTRVAKILKKADKALYQAKTDGRNQVVLYTSALTE